MVQVVRTERTNLCTNPSFETNTTGWSGFDATVTQSALEAYSGSYSASVNVTVANGVAIYAITGATVGQQYIAKVRVKGTAGEVVFIQFTTLGSGSYAQITLDGTWQDLTTVVTTATSTTGNLEIGKTNTGVFYLDGVQFEQNTIAQDYFDGDSGINYFWNGTAHASTSYQSNFIGEEIDTYRNIAHSLQVAWKKNYLPTYRPFTIGVSLIGGSDGIASEGAIVSDWNAYQYTDESDYVEKIVVERSLSQPIGGVSKALANVTLANLSSSTTSVPIYATPTIDSTSNGGVANTQTSRTWSHTVGAGSNMTLFVLVMARDSSGTGDEVVASVARDGQSFTLVDTVSNATGNLRNEIWKLDSPNVNTSDITVTFTGSCQTVSAMGISVYGVDTTSIASQDATGNSTAPSVSITASLSNSIMIANMSADTSTSNTTDTSTAIYNNDGSRQHGAGYSVGSSMTFDFTLGGAAQWAVHAISVNPAITGYSPAGNDNGRFTPDYMGGSSELYTALVPRRPMIIGSGFDFNGVYDTIPQFVGITTKAPIVNVRDRSVELVGADFIDYLQKADITDAAMFTSQRSDQVIENILVQLGFSTAQYDLDYGINTIKFGEFQPGQHFGDIIHKIVQAENGQFYQAENGKLRFDNRQKWTQSPYTSPARVLATSQVLEVDQEGEDHIINVVEVKSKPRSKQSGQLIWKLGQPIAIAANGRTEVFVNFEDPIIQVYTPSIYKVYTNSDETGTNITGNVSVYRVDSFARAAKITFINSSTTAGYLTQMEVYGRPAKQSDEIFYREQDDSSVTAYEERVYSIENEYIQDRTWAQSLAGMILQDYAEPGGIQTIKIRAIPELQLGDLISWQGRYWRIISIKSSMSAQTGFVQEIKMIQRTISTYFRIGISSIGGSDMISP